MKKIDTKSAVLEKKSPELYEISQTAALVIEQKTGVTFAGICSQIKRNDIYKARILFSGVLSSYGIQSGKIAQLIYKKKPNVETYITEYNRKLKTSVEFQKIKEEVENSINN